MGVPFYQISIGGLRDVTYFTGSMRCWKGAHQGKFTDILIKEGCLNPIIYIDELDKVSVETAQDIYGLLTHVADPMTNKHIQDLYLGMDLDLSKVTFIFSYNDGTLLPAPLRDRIKEIQFDGFNADQRLDIARDFIIPTYLKEYGLQQTDIKFDMNAIAHANGIMQTASAVPEQTGVRFLNKGYQSLIGKIMVNVVCDRDSYSAVRSGNTAKRAAPGKVRPRRRAGAPATNSHQPASVRFMPYHRPIKLPYTVRTEDIDYYLMDWEH